MTITHHPDIATLMSCAAGSQPEALAAVIASHISHVPCVRAPRSPGCRRSASRCSTASSRRCRRTDAPVDRGARRRGRGRGRTAAALAGATCPLRRLPLASARRLDDIPWKRIGAGHVALPDSLSKGAERRSAPDQGRAGQGAPRARPSRRGADAPPARQLPRRVRHLPQRATSPTSTTTSSTSPVADAIDGCICLIASERKARFKGLIARLMQPFIGV